MNDRLNYMLLPMTLGGFCAAFDNNVLNICLPILSREFNASIGLVQFVSSAYMFTICSLLLIFAYISSSMGRKYVFSIGIGLFSLGCLGAAFSSTIYSLIIFRVVQGVGAAMYMANGMALINSHFSNQVKGRAFGVISMVNALASILGPMGGGFVAAWLGWRAVFILLAPLALLAAILAWLFLQEEENQPLGQFDYSGAVYSGLFIVLCVISFVAIEKQNILWLVLSLLGAVTLFRRFVNTERSAPNPLVNIGVFSRRVFVRANVTATLIFAIMLGAGVLLPVYIQDTLNYSSYYSGLVMASMAVSIFAVSYLGGFLTDRIGSAKVTMSGIVAVLLGMLTLGGAVGVGANWLLFVGNLILGIGVGLFNPANNALVMTSIPPNLAATGASINVLLRNSGVAIGTVVSGLIYDLFLGMGYASGKAVLYSLTLFVFFSLTMLLIERSGIKGDEKECTYMLN